MGPIRRYLIGSDWQRWVNFCPLRQSWDASVQHPFFAAIE